MEISIVNAKDSTPTQTPEPSVQQTTEQIMTMQSQITATSEPHQALNPGRRDTPVRQNPESPQTNSIGDDAHSSLWQIIAAMLIIVAILIKGKI